ncbi:MAG: elongation factor Ts [Gammaproteobacteria bacterium]|nr:elongation factor Ts [Gammaproteobacteria bacterium]MYF12123.1 elongation factor Ts [Gammaproteobacteria bacterium]MYF49768.1 elongation factor Ts [Gammaproteobacteria bacterium]MYH16848.1 elongation factor Ts [Gammaproteobacteria bacterium]MYK82016.1 elongation factor Ts [Gammaproteobacteria bacterium]
MPISAKQVKELRDRTGLGMMDCKAALQEADGDLEQAIDALRRKSALKAAKKASRTAAQGLLGLKVAADGKRAALVEVNIETDFAARNPKFVAFVDRVAAAALEAGADGAELANSFAEEREALVQEIGENINVRRAETLVAETGCIGSYLHNDGRKGALVELSIDDAELGRDLAMHITAHDPTPLVVRSADLDASVIAKEREIFTAQAADSGKPPNIVEKIVEGRVRKFLAEVSLIDQAFIKDGELKVGKLLGAKGAETRRFARLEVGEGIAVAEEDFAAEVAAQAAGGS